MERRLAITYIVSATATFGFGCVAIAAAGGGLFASAAPKPAGGKQIEVVDDYVVIHSSTTVLALSDVAIAPLEPSADSPRWAISRSGTAPSPASGGAAVPEAAQASDTPEPGANSPLSIGPTATPAPAAEPAPTASEPDPPQSTQPAATNPPAPAAPSSAAPAARPPIPDGCDNPRFASGTWQCDDD